MSPSDYDRSLAEALAPCLVLAATALAWAAYHLPDFAIWLVRP